MNPKQCLDVAQNPLGPYSPYKNQRDPKVLQLHMRAGLLEWASAMARVRLIDGDDFLVGDNVPNLVHDGVVVHIHRERQRRRDNRPCTEVTPSLVVAEARVARATRAVLAANLAMLGGSRVAVFPDTGLRWLESKDPAGSICCLVFGVQATSSMSGYAQHPGLRSQHALSWEATVGTSFGICYSRSY